MANQVSEYMLIFFLAFVSIIILFIVYVGFLNTQNSIMGSIENEEYKSNCDCFSEVSLTESELAVRNINCDYVSWFIAKWPDFEYQYNDTLKKGETAMIPHESLSKENYSLIYNGCK